MDQVVPLGDLEPVAIDDRLVLDPDGVHGPTVLAEPDHQPRRRDRLGDPDPHQAEVGQIPAGLQGVLELDRLVRRERVGLQADQLDGRVTRRRRAGRSPGPGRPRRRRGTSRRGWARCSARSRRCRSRTRCRPAGRRRPAGGPRPSRSRIVLLYSCRFSRRITTGRRAGLLAALGGQEVVLDPADQRVPLRWRTAGARPPGA